MDKNKDGFIDIDEYIGSFATDFLWTVVAQFSKSLGQWYQPEKGRKEPEWVERERKNFKENRYGKETEPKQ